MMMPLILFLCTLFSVHICTGIHDVVSIDITTAAHHGAEAEDPIIITLWFNSTIYRYRLLANISNHTFSNAEFNILGSSSCHKAHYNNVPEAKIMIENNRSNNIIINTIAVHTKDAWYGINGRCVDDALIQAQKWLSLPDWAHFIINESSCSSGRSNIFMCVDKERHWYACDPSKQIFYFDTLRATQFINNAIWIDGTDVEPEIVTCDPTNNTTDIPLSSQSSTSIIGHNESVNDERMNVLQWIKKNIIIVVVVAILIIIIGVLLYIVYYFKGRLQENQVNVKEIMDNNAIANVENNDKDVELQKKAKGEEDEMEQISQQDSDLSEGAKDRNGASFVLDPEGITDGIRPDDCIVEGAKTETIITKPVESLTKR